MASPLKSVDPSVSAVSGMMKGRSAVSTGCLFFLICLALLQAPASKSTLAQPYSPWKENIYLVENDRRALERDIRRTKNRMEGDLKAVLEQSRRGRGAPELPPSRLQRPASARLCLVGLWGRLVICEGATALQRFRGGVFLPHRRCCRCRITSADAREGAKAGDECGGAGGAHRG